MTENKLVWKQSNLGGGDKIRGCIASISDAFSKFILFSDRIV